MPSSIEVRGLTKSYGSVVAVRDLNLDLPAGEIYGLLGPNGAGKTTTLRCIMGFLNSSAGSVRILGGDARDAHIRARIGYLPGDLRLDRHLTGATILNGLARLGRHDPRTMNALAERLDVSLHRRTGELSRGNRQKIGVIAALMHSPDVIILDEPTSGLDPLVQQAVLDLLRERAALGAAILLSSHLLSEVEVTAHRVGMLREGACVLEAPVDDLLMQARTTLHVRLPHAPSASFLADTEHVVSTSWQDGEGVVVIDGPPAQALRALSDAGITSIRTGGRELHDVFAHLYRKEASR